MRGLLPRRKKAPGIISDFPFCLLPSLFAPRANAQFRAAFCLAVARSGTPVEQARWEGQRTVDRRLCGLYLWGADREQDPGPTPLAGDYSRDIRVLLHYEGLQPAAMMNRRRDFHSVTPRPFADPGRGLHLRCSALSAAALSVRSAAPAFSPWLPRQAR